MGYHKEKSKQVVIQVTERELFTVMAALRFWQRKAAETNPTEMIIARNGGSVLHALSNVEIDNLCTQIATGYREVSQRFTSAQDLDLLNHAGRYEGVINGPKR